MESSIFMDKQPVPVEDDVKQALGHMYKFWEELKKYTLGKYPGGIEEWFYAGKKYGWGFRIKDKKRAIIYLGPRDKYFLASLVFGGKATDQALRSNIPAEIKSIIESAPVYAEGRGVRFEVRDGKYINDIKTLIDIKLAN